jgi:hypothetical protein
MPLNREWLDGRMAELGITVSTLRNRHGISIYTIQSWDAGARPRPETLRRLAEVLQVTYMDLVRHLNVSPGDFSDVGERLTAARLNKPKRKRA